MHARNRLAALLAVAALVALLPLRSGHLRLDSGRDGAAGSITAASVADARISGAALHDEGSCSTCRALRDARSLAPPALAASQATRPAAAPWAADRDPALPRAAFLGGAAPRAPPLG